MQPNLNAGRKCLRTLFGRHLDAGWTTIPLYLLESSSMLKSVTLATTKSRSVAPYVKSIATTRTPYILQSCFIHAKTVERSKGLPLCMSPADNPGDARENP
jgi:hypothetical protein